MKIKSRYLLIEGDRGLIEKSVFYFLGEDGVSKLNFKILFLFKGKWVAKCYLKGVDEIIGALALKTSEKEKPVVMRVVKISGTLKSLFS